MSLTEKGFVFWPVGTGDSTSVVINDEIVLQVDLRHLACANEEDDPHSPIVDVLVDQLPRRANSPYLAAFALTHPDTDHILGFADLLARVRIGELWFTPRIFREYNKDLCPDALAFKEEAMRRVRLMIQHNGEVESGDRVRLIGYDILLDDPDYHGFPQEYFTVPGNWVFEIDRMQLQQEFATFIHAPFKDDSAGERNETSLAMQVNLISGQTVSKALLLGDLSYPTIRRIFDTSRASGKQDTLEWNVLLAPHHCSKSVMYQRDPESGEQKLMQDILDDLNAAQLPMGYVVASSDPIPARNSSGDNPPHAKAKARYEEIVRNSFLCTQEHGGQGAPVPITFVHGEHGLSYAFVDAPGGSVGGSVTGLAAGVKAARGSDEPPHEKVGFGRA